MFFIDNKTLKNDLFGYHDHLNHFDFHPITKIVKNLTAQNKFIDGR